MAQVRIEVLRAGTWAVRQNGAADVTAADLVARLPAYAIQYPHRAYLDGVLVVETPHTKDRPMRASPSLPIRDMNGVVCKATVRLPPALVAMVHNHTLPGVLPSRGGAEWELHGTTLVIFSRSFVDPHADTSEAVGFVEELIALYGRRKVNLPSNGELRAAADAWNIKRRHCLVGPNWERQQRGATSPLYRQVASQGPSAP
jgi:hypothetical protein